VAVGDVGHRPRANHVTRDPVLHDEGAGRPCIGSV
jgi:hypothetical protein